MILVLVDIIVDNSIVDDDFLALDDDDDVRENDDIRHALRSSLCLCITACTVMEGI